MKFLRLFFLLTCLTICTSFTAHKFYVSITKVEFSEEEQTVQIITKLFIDDIEDVLQERYSSSITLGKESETASDTEILEEYILHKLKIEINGKAAVLNYLGHEYDNDVLKSYIEIENISEFKSISVENKMLMELFVEQQNLIHVKRFKKRKTLVLDVDNPKGLLNFN